MNQQPYSPAPFRPPPPPPRWQDNTVRNQKRILIGVGVFFAASLIVYGVGSAFGYNPDGAKATATSPAATPTTAASKVASKLPAKKAAGGAQTTTTQTTEAVSPQPSDQGSGVRNFLPRLHNVSGIRALSAGCRDVWYFAHGSSVIVTVAFQGPGNLHVDVFPVPGDGTNDRTQLYTVSSQESGHTFEFRDVLGEVDHVQLTVTAAQGVDQCYARKG